MNPKARQNQERYQRSKQSLRRTPTEIVSDMADALARLRKLTEVPHAQTQVHSQAPNAPYQASCLYPPLSRDSQRTPKRVGHDGRPSGDRVGQYYEFDSFFDHESQIGYDPLLRHLRPHHGQGSEPDHRQVSDRQTYRIGPYTVSGTAWTAKDSEAQPVVTYDRDYWRRL